MMDLVTDDVLRRQVLDYIESSEPEPGAFDELALALFRHQFRRNDPYRRLIEARGINAADISAWQQIPAVSTQAFKRLRLACAPSVMTFRTSGTTRGGEGRGEHHLADLRIYRAALRRQFKTFVLPDLSRIRFLSLVPAPEWAPDSSLGFMMADLHATLGGEGSAFFLMPEGVAIEPLIGALRDAESSRQPVCLAGVAFAFVHLIDALRKRGVTFHLPSGSRLMDTGGFKGRSRSIEREELLAAYHECFGIAPERVVNEYGMTELCSQFYDAALLGGDPNLKFGPHWLRTLIIDPESGLPLPDGKVGLLRHYDLANFDSVLAVETEDLGVWRGRGFQLLGRAAGAEPRGCSLIVPDPPLA